MRLTPLTWRTETRAAVLAFGLAISATLAAIGSGAGRRGVDFLVRNVDPEVVVFVVPTLAIVLAMFVLASRLALHGSIPAPRGQPIRSLRWKPGENEG